MMLDPLLITELDLSLVRHVNIVFNLSKNCVSSTMIISQENKDKTGERRVLMTYTALECSVLKSQNDRIDLYLTKEA